MAFRRRLRKDGSVADIRERRTQKTPRQGVPPDRGVNRGSPHLLGRLKFLGKRTVSAFFEDKVPRLGAALAYYTTVAVAPLLVVAIAVAGWFFDEGTARQRVLGEIQHLAGSNVTQALNSVQSPSQQSGNVWATVIGGATLLFGAFGVFGHLQDALNSIWRVEDKSGETWAGKLKRRLFSLATVVGTGFLLIVSLVVSAALSWAGQRTGNLLGVPEGFLQWVNFALSFIVLSGVFAAIFKILPDAQIRWRHVWLGGVVTALLFNLGKAGLGFYFAKAKVGAGYGIASSAIALLIWSYYAAQIVFLGAEFTRVHSLTLAGRDPHALDQEKPRTHSSQYGTKTAADSPRVPDKTAK
jgi:membrane protein